MENGHALVVTNTNLHCLLEHLKGVIIENLKKKMNKLSAINHAQRET